MAFLSVLVATGTMTSSGSVVGEVAYVVVGPNEIDFVPLFLLTPSLRKDDLIRGETSDVDPIGIDLVNKAAKSKVGGTLSCGTGASGGSRLDPDPNTVEQEDDDDDEEEEEEEVEK